MAETRHKLAKRVNERSIYTAEFVRTGVKRGFNGGTLETILFKDIKDTNGKLMASHMWFNLGSELRYADLQPGDIIQFKAHVKPYLKGYNVRREDIYQEVEEDYTLSRPTQIRKIGRIGACC